MTVQVMNVRCGECGTVYRVNPAKVPSGGIRARCARCTAIIEVGSLEREAAAQEMVSTQVPARPTPTDQRPRTLPVAQPPEKAPGEEAAVEQAPDVAMVEHSLAVSPVDSEEVGPPPFGSANAEDRARTLARALVSDITVYHRDRWERSLRLGMLRQDLRGEIRKSWEEYVGQVGNQMARETSYFRDALNEILARGAQLF